MSERPLERLDPASYRNLVRLAVGPEFPFALCDANWTPVWSSEGCSRMGVAMALRAVERDALVAQGASVVRAELETGATLLAAAVAGSDGSVLGWLAGVAPAPSAASTAGDSERRLEVLREVADRLARDAKQDVEINGMAEELADRNEELHLVYSFERKLRGKSSGLDGIGLVLGDFADALSLDVAAFVLPGRPVISCTDHAFEPVANMDLVMTQVRHNLYRFVATRKKSIVMNGQGDEERRRYLFSDMPFRVLAYPVLEGTKVEGMLVLLRHFERPAFSNGDLNLAGAIVQQAALILRSEQMIEKMRRFGGQLAGALIAAVEAKDPYTRGHSERVQAISLHLGGDLGLMEAELEDIYWGALLHDVGKIGVPDTILSKPTTLTKDEYVFIQEHPECSYEILKHIEHLRSGALEGARFHQEHYDGRGYPHGLAGERIPHIARVIAVGDTYDAITTSRAYRPAATHEWALEEIARVAGTQLDPDLVASFLRLCAADNTWLARITASRGG